MLAVNTLRHTTSLDLNNSRVRCGVAAWRIHLQKNRSHVLFYSRPQDPILHRGRHPRLLMPSAPNPQAFGSTKPVAACLCLGFPTSAQTYSIDAQQESDVLYIPFGKNQAISKKMTHLGKTLLYLAQYYHYSVPLRKTSTPI